MPAEEYREEAISQLEDAVQADDQDTKNFHIREALQLLRISEEQTQTETVSESGTAE